MVVEHIHKLFVNVAFNKYGEYESSSDVCSVDIDVEYDELNQLCKDLLEIIKSENVKSFWICKPHYCGLSYDIRDEYFDLEWIEKIVFKEYYMLIDGYKILYNSIFDFGRSRNW